MTEPIQPASSLGSGALAAPQRDWKMIALVIAIAFIVWSQVKVSRPDPSPGPNPAPKVDKELMEGSRDAMRTFVSRMADDLAAAKTAIKGGKIKTVTELADLTNASDQATRKLFKDSMGKLLAPRLGTGNLPEATESILTDMENGFRKVVK